MVDTPSTGETATPQAPSNAPSETSAPATPVNTSDPIVEAARKEAEQARMRANQLENELAKERQKKADDEKAKLEENAQYKDLADKLASELEAIKSEKAEAEKQATLSAETATVLSEYPETVKKLAQAAGLSLTDNSEAGKALLKSKLDTLTAEVAAVSPTTNEVATNPSSPAPGSTDYAALTTPNVQGISPMAAADAQGGKVADDILRDYINKHPSLSSALETLRKQQRGETLGV